MMTTTQVDVLLIVPHTNSNVHVGASKIEQPYIGRGVQLDGN